jgi:hypothetical protein
MNGLNKYLFLPHAGRALTFFIDKNTSTKNLGLKKVMAPHRSLSNLHAFSFARGSFFF